MPGAILAFSRSLRLAGTLGAALALAAAAPYQDSPFVAIGAVRLDVRKDPAAQIPAGWIAAPREGVADPYRLVKFSGPVGSAERQRLEAAGWAVIAAYPVGAFLVRPAAGASPGDPALLDKVAWVGPFHPYFKIDERLAEAWERDDPASFSGGDGWGLRFVVGLHEEIGRPAVEAAVAALPGVGRLHPTRGPIRVEIDPASFRGFLQAAAAIPQVAFVEPWLPPQALNDENVQTGQSGACVNDGAEAARTPIFNHGLTGWGAVLAVADTCFDTNEGWFWDDVLDRLPAHEPNAPWTSVLPDWGQRKIIEYYDMFSSDTTIGCAGNVGCPSGSFCPDHGSHVAGTLVSNCNLDAEGVATSTNPANSDGDNDGMAPGAKLVAQDLGNGGLGYIATDGGDLGELVRVAYDNTCVGATCFIDSHSNSWGFSTDQYTTDAREADAALWDLKNVNVFAAAGNSGSGFNTVISPAVGKNVIAVGNALNCSVNDISSSSSRGDSSDGRLKPDVVATGSSVTSALNDGNGTTLANGGCQTLTISGTSMATPTAAGLSALVVQYFRDGFYPSGTGTPEGLNPSGPLRKAVMINTAQRMTGTDAERQGVTWPNMDQGWGYVVLENALYFAGDARKLWVHDETTGVDVSGPASLSFQRKVTSATEPLKVTLSWFDVEHPGSCGGTTPCMLNDLDLTVTDETTDTVYRSTLVTGTTGHVVPRTVVPASPGVGQTTTDNGPDDLNTVEQIIVYNPAPGTIFTFTVTAANTPNGPIPFGLVATGALADPCSAPTGAAAPSVADLDACADGGVQVSWGVDPTAWNDDGAGVRSYRVLRNGMPIGFGGCAGVKAYGVVSCVDNTGPNNQTAEYRIEYTNGCGTGLASAPAAGTDRLAQVVSVTPASDSTCVDSSLVFTASVVPASPGLIYQWTEDGIDVPGATAKTLSVTKGSVQSHSYNCRVTQPSPLCVAVDSSPSTGSWEADHEDCPQLVGEVSSHASGRPLQVNQAGNLVSLRFENVGALHYNVYVSTGGFTLPFDVTAPEGKKSCAVGWLPSIGGTVVVSNYNVEQGITTPSEVYYILVTGDNGGSSEGSLGFTSSGAGRSADSSCAD